GAANPPSGRWRCWCKHRDERDADREGRDRYPPTVSSHRLPVEETGFFGTAEDAGVLAGLDVWIALTFPSRKIRKRRHETVFETSIASRDRRFESGPLQRRVCELVSLRPLSARACKPRRATAIFSRRSPH